MTTRNPKTGRLIRVGGRTFKNIIKEGYAHHNNNKLYKENDTDNDIQENSSDDENDIELGNEKFNNINTSSKIYEQENNESANTCWVGFNYLLKILELIYNFISYIGTFEKLYNNLVSLEIVSNEFYISHWIKCIYKIIVYGMFPIIKMSTENNHKFLNTFDIVLCLTHCVIYTFYGSMIDGHNATISLSISILYC